jgi:hypothetical protein
MLAVAVATAAALVLAGEGFAQATGPGAMGGCIGAGVCPGAPGAGMGPGAMMGRGMMGRGMMGRGAGQGPCPFVTGGETGAQGTAITEDQAREAAQKYADQYLKGFTVERVLPFQARWGTAYSVELLGPEGQVRTFHINPWGNVMPFGGPGRRAG